MPHPRKTELESHTDFCRDLRENPVPPTTSARAVHLKAGDIGDRLGEGDFHFAGDGGRLVDPLELDRQVTSLGTPS